VSDVLHPVRDATALEAALTVRAAVLYKHSTRCGVSSGSLIEMRQFAERHPDVPVYIVDVVADRDIARRSADATGVGHESPQVILLVAGHAVWDASHFSVSCSRLERALVEHVVPSAADRESLPPRGTE
jgi:bacillithiol system protein YtxJ